MPGKKKKGKKGKKGGKKGTGIDAQDNALADGLQQMRARRQREREEAEERERVEQAERKRRQEEHDRKVREAEYDPRDALRHPLSRLRPDLHSAEECFHKLQQLTVLINEMETNDSACAEVYVRRSTLYAVFARYRRARADAIRALDLDAESGEAWFRLGWAEYGLLRYREASHAFMQGTHLLPQSQAMKYALQEAIRAMHAVKVAPPIQIESGPDPAERVPPMLTLDFGDLGDLATDDR